MQQFLEFIDRKQREAHKHLRLLEQLLRHGGMQVKDHIDEEDSYIFVKSPNTKLSFDGIRIYEIGNMIGYRIQKEEKTHPYGKSYRLDLEDMYNDYMSEGMKPEHAGKKVMHSVVEELKKFFDRSVKAESEMDSVQDGGGLILKTGGTDYSSTVLNKV